MRATGDLTGFFVATNDDYDDGNNNNNELFICVLIRSQMVI
jgi:hypothetical protein